ncbi:hypothetical protein, partial [Pseudomonas aeruginosa]|uniref:hypothetical protein n=1 Tax=Pseudomonas aeruginosa TaxID=287 RepID=UPI000A7DA80D
LQQGVAAVRRARAFTGGDLAPSSIPDQEQAISALPDYASQPGKPPREDLK